MTYSFIGGGSFGTALAVLLSETKSLIKIYDRDEDIINSINKQRKNIKYMKNLSIPDNILATSDINTAIKDSEVIFISVPSHVVRDVSSLMKKYIDKNSTVVCLSKGIEINTFKRLSEVLREELPENDIVTLSGPSHAEEIAQKKPTTMVVSSSNPEKSIFIQNLLSNDVLRLYTNDDTIGVELGGTLKNIVAIGIGIASGLGYGDNTIAAIITRALHEMVKIGVVLGGRKETFFGLTGIGDLMVTCMSEHSRNRRCGFLIGKNGLSLKEATEEIGMVVEGIKACEAMYLIHKEKNIDLPIIVSIYNILFNDYKPQHIEKYLMNREKKNETDLIY